jgi:hypothetical protein
MNNPWFVCVSGGCIDSGEALYNKSTAAALTSSVGQVHRGPS